MDILGKIITLCEERKWTLNNLAMEAGLTQSTLSSMKQRNTPPKIDTLQLICNAFGITLAQFFLEDEKVEVLSADEKKLIYSYRKLSNDKKIALLNLVKK